MLPLFLLLSVFMSFASILCPAIGCICNVYELYVDNPAWPREPGSDADNTRAGQRDVEDQEARVKRRRQVTKCDQSENRRAMVVVAGSQRVGSWTTSTWPPIPPRSSTLSLGRTPSTRVRLTSQREWREWRWSAGLWRWQAPRWAPGQLSNLTWPLSWAPGRPVGDFSKFQISGLGSLAREFGAQE